MIDLRRGALPSCLLVEGERFPIETGFRTWLAIDDRGYITPAIFTERIPEGDWLPAAREFLASENQCPHGVNSGSERTLDLVQDGDYITASFMQAYGIDLTTADMHWHLFLALLRGLPKQTKLAEIIGYRGYKNDKRKPETVMQQLKREWSLPPKEDKALKAWAEQAFGNIEFNYEGSD